MFRIFKHSASVVLIAVYFCGIIAPIIERSIYQLLPTYTLSLKTKGDNSSPIAKSKPAKMPQRFVKATNGFSFSPILSEKPCTDQKIGSSSTIHPSNLDRTCLFLACSLLSDRAPPTL
jgi:hypothetical protein